MSDNDKTIKKLIKEIEALKLRVSALDLLVSSLSLQKTPNFNPWPITPLENNCPKCGLDISKPLGYSCPNLHCPVGLGPTVCGG